MIDKYSWLQNEVFGSKLDLVFTLIFGVGDGGRGQNNQFHSAYKKYTRKPIYLFQSECNIHNY